MLIQILATANFLLGTYDAFVTQRRIKAFGVNFELNRLIKYLSTRLGPDLASVIGVLGPSVGWTFILTYFHAPILLALLVGFNLKRFEMQLASKPTEAAMLEVKKRIDEFRAGAAPLPAGESTPTPARLSSGEDK